MQTRRHLTFLALLIATFLAAPLGAHEGHKSNMSDEEMVMMEASSIDAKTNHGTGGAIAHSHSASAEHSMSADQMMQQKIEENRLTSFSDLLARLHPIAAHFPIALFLVAALTEFGLILRPSLGLQTTVRFLVAAGAIGGLGTAAFGWFAAGWRLSDRSETLAIHRWNGTAIAAAGLLAWWLSSPGKNRWWLRLVLAIIAGALIVQGYYGGAMVHGPNHMGVM